MGYIIIIIINALFVNKLMIDSIGLLLVERKKALKA